MEIYRKILLYLILKILNFIIIFYYNYIIFIGNYNQALNETSVSNITNKDNSTLVEDKFIMFKCWNFTELTQENSTANWL